MKEMVGSNAGSKLYFRRGSWEDQRQGLARSARLMRDSRDLPSGALTAWEEIALPRASLARPARSGHGTTASS